MTLTIWKPPSLGLEFQDQPRGVGGGRGREGACSLDEAQPLPDLLLWSCFHHEPHFLGGVHLFQVSDPAMGTSLVGATLPDCTSIYHTQTGGSCGGFGPPFLQKEQEEELLSLCCA